MKQGWEIKKLGEIAEITDYVANGSFATLRENVTYLNDDGYAILVRLADYTNAFDESKFVYIDEHAYNFLAKSKLYGGEIIMSNVGSIGKSFICPKLNKPMSLAPNSIVIKTPNNAFYHYLFGSTHFQSDIRGISSQTALPKFNKTSFKTISVPVPPIEEQERIVAELDCLSGVIEKKREQLKELDALAESIFYTMFGSVDDNHNNFDIKPLSDVFSLIKDGTHQTPQYTDDIENGIIFLSAKDVVSGEINWSNIKYIPKSLHIELHKRVAPQKNDILLCKNGTYGICALNETDEVFDIYVSLALLRPNDICMPKYLVYAINNKSTKLQFDKSIKGIGVPNLHLGEIKKTCIIVPPLELQQEFADKIEAIEKQKELIKQSITETEELFNSRMDYYFNG